MRNNSWKRPVVIALAFIIGIIAGITVGVWVPEQFSQFRGIAIFGTIALVSAVIVFITVRIFKVGEDD